MSFLFNKYCYFVDKQNMNAVLLRHFNPVGAHKSGRIGEDPQVSDV